jgi:hypothetical protein
MNIATLSVSLLASLLIVPLAAFAQNDNAPQPSGEDIVKAQKIAESDERVQSYMAGKSHSLMSYGSTTNEKTHPGVSYITLVYNIENKDQLAVTVDLKNESVVDIQYIADFIPTFAATPENKEPTIIALLTSFLPLVIAFGAATVGVSFFLLRRKTRQTSVTS